MRLLRRLRRMLRDREQEPKKAKEHDEEAIYISIRAK
jgi:hypothetical protein